MMMSFKKKYNQCLRNLENVSKPDYPYDDTNLYADFVELLVVFSKGDGLTHGDIIDRFFGEPEPDQKSSSEKNDDNESLINNIFSLIGERSFLYGNIYPFDLGNGQIISLRTDLSLPQKLYLFLLFSSSLDIFNTFNTEITIDFGLVSCEAIRSYLPHAIVKPFGKLSEYKGKTKAKIKKLANDIGLPTSKDDFDCVSEKNIQDRGLDIVSWIPFEDNCQNKIIFLCQCACGKQYEYKQHDLRRFKNYFVYCKTNPLLTLFIPYSLINPQNGKFYHSDYFEQDYLIFERLRIIHLTKLKDNILSMLNSSVLINRCIQDYSK